MSRFQRLLVMVGGLLGAIAVTGVMAGSGGVLRGGSSPDQPLPALASADIITPDSIVAASEDSPDGGTEVVGDVIDCPSGEDTAFKFEQSASEFEVTGALVSFDGTTIVVTGPDGEVEADAATQALEKAQEKFAAKSSKGHGPPDGVPAQGRN